jgi:hypothetical protein
MVLQQPAMTSIDPRDGLGRWPHVIYSIDSVCGDALNAGSQLEWTRQRALGSPWRAALLHIGTEA